MRIGLNLNTDKDERLEEKLQGIDNFFNNPQNIKTIEQNKKLSEKAFNLVKDGQNNLIKELNTDLNKSTII